MEEVEKKLRNIRLRGSLQSHVVKNQLIEVVSEKIKKSVPELAKLRVDAELLNLVCSCIETLLDSKKTKLDKKEIVLTIWVHLFPDVSKEELEIIDNTIEFLVSNKLVRKLKNKYFSKFFKCFSKNG